MRALLGALAGRSCAPKGSKAMRVEEGGPTQRKVMEIVGLWTTRNAYVNDEYQRGDAWSPVQKRRLIDSVFRGYALPMFYLRRVTKLDLDGKPRAEAEIIDGQQRLRALAEYRSDDWAALDASDPKLAVPDSIRHEPCPWGGRTFSQLTPDLQLLFDETTLTVAVIDEDAKDDEIRDLFIRLQAGTALTRQQIRDAWPGNVAPFIVKIAGKKSTRPRYRLFFRIGKWDRQGDEGEAEDEDPYHGHRQTCAQLLCLFHRRWHDPQDLPSVNAKALDELYHTMVDLDEASEEIRAFEQVLKWCDEIVVEGPYSKLRKLELFSLFLFLTDLQAAHDVPVNAELPKIKHAFANLPSEGEPPTAGKRLTSAVRIGEYYDWFVRHAIGSLVLAGLDPVRLFTDEDKARLWEACLDEHGQARCAVCNQPISQNDVEYDHIRPYIRGGRTTVENGRVVHPACHLRGRLAAAFVP